MNWKALRDAFMIVCSILIFSYLVITLSNVKSDKADFKIKNTIIETRDSVLQYKCDSLIYVVDSIEKIKKNNDSIIAKLNNTKSIIHTKYVTDKKHWLDNDSTVYYIKQYLSGYTEREF